MGLSRISRKSLTINVASEGIRTLDTHVGNVMLYQAELRSLPNKPAKFTRISPEGKKSFSAFLIADSLA